MFADEELARAAEEAASALAESLPDPADCQHEISPEFEEKISKICRIWDEDTQRYI